MKDVASVLVGVLFVAFGLGQAAWPRAFFDFNKRGSRWEYKNPEAVQPSDAYLTYSRVIGLAFAVIGVVLVVTSL
ncbi:hypothetical protein EV189_1688 [Motilibacter rhizosphaerae]|uniref:DUF6199 domain-containing protein n=1 Tax=Motilibacter rhizosphaerae TaxID=598652 RepID=A0A4Q7NSZ3_9ACTN|nr:DUF6199 family natural product biosynthesis protein [Motilibacter rhizosphaerae]RZS89908.1 hypothetical protein EV189_1688 [Motilibacter rhizosphaerae]